MEQQSESSFLNVTDPVAVSLLMRKRPRRVLLAFLGRENTVKGASDETGIDIRMLHRDVLALQKVNLLRIVRISQRGGRGIKIYRSVSDAFFIDHLNTSASDLGEWDGRSIHELDHLFHIAAAREFARALRESGREWGMRLYALPDPPGYRVDEGDRHGKLTDPLMEWAGPQARMISGMPLFYLTDETAREVQLDFIRLMQKARALQERETAELARPYLLRVGLAPLTNEEARQLFRK